MVNRLKSEIGCPTVHTFKDFRLQMGVAQQSIDRFGKTFCVAHGYKQTRFAVVEDFSWTRRTVCCHH